ncbi:MULTISPECIES: phospholipase D family protein [unclassified Pseudoxanthomonas]|uniref:phospholipase D family protein n=1 Tax=unclassified Pseudoxanthomonas TaxID=2645906 RepID=UPI0008EB281F|nr:MULTISPECIES: phospholipase D family protein [unclassified Pseudoxanthomonas]SFV31514.1 PLD-like domain-containing protein [Pseudoxanthomonas sp. YR558]
MNHRRAAVIAARCAVLWLALLCSACASLSDRQRDRAAGIAAAARSQVVECTQADACALRSPLYDLGDEARASSTPEAPRHYAVILDQGSDALLARLNLIRSAREHIDLQTYIFDKDDSARLVLDELLGAARRGVKVRLLIDQLSAIADLEILAALSGAHENFAIRIYNPSFGKAKLNYLDYAGSVLCCFRRFNQRMHTKLLLVDGRVGISGGRNYQDDYYDWDAEYNFRDRDVLVAGPEAEAMARNFQLFWEARRSVPAERLNDVGRTLLDEGVPAMPVPRYLRPERVQAASADASNAAVIRERFVDTAYPVGAVRYIADLPQKHRRERRDDDAPAAPELEALIRSAQTEVLLQTPYLVMSKQAQAMFREMRQRQPPPQVVVSTNSLAATDNPVVYSMSFKYKRRYLREFGFQIHEFKPFPEDAPVDYAALMPEGPPLTSPGGEAGGGSGIRGPSGSIGPSSGGPSSASSGETTRRLQRTESRPSFLSSGAGSEPLPLKRAGVRMGLHAKSMVIDGETAVIGTHNFDPRSENYNTEAAVVIQDTAFAQALADSIRRDMSPRNAWVIAPRAKPVVFSGLDYSLGKVSEALPIFDIWPWRYATSYEFQPGPDCPLPVTPKDPAFHRCYVSVGDFPEVNVGPKWLYTRVLTAFGAGLVPIL